MNTVESCYNLITWYESGNDRISCQSKGEYARKKIRMTNSNKHFVPRQLIKHHYPHPEFYGESIVELTNGMTTDVYTDDDGTLFTLTNDEDLIQYLMKNALPELMIHLTDGFISLRTITPKDSTLLSKWIPSSPDPRYHNKPLSEQHYLEFLSHSITSQSHMFIVSTKDVPIGFVAYAVINKDAFIELCFPITTNHHSDKTLSLLMHHIQTNHTISRYVSIVWENDMMTIETLIRNGFQRDPEQDCWSYATRTLKIRDILLYKNA